MQHEVRDNVAVHLIDADGWTPEEGEKLVCGERPMAHPRWILEHSTTVFPERANCPACLDKAGRR